MATTSFLSTLWMFLVPLFAILLPLWIGQRYGMHIRRRSSEFQDAPISSAVGASLALFAFMLAFTFEMVSNRFEKRKELLVSEISDIRSSYLNAGLVPEPIRSKARQFIIEYVDARVALSRDFSQLQHAKLRSQQILDSLWHYSEELAAQDRSSEAYSLFISSVNNLVNSFNERVTVALQFRLPVAVLYVLSFVAFFSTIALGFQFGISGKTNFLINLLVGITFAAVMWLIFALDHPEAGVIRISETPMITLQQQLHH
jgi:Protein of unknown function (DUF4239)